MGRGTVTFGAVGDVGFHGAIGDAMLANGRGWPFEAVKADLARADVLFGNMESVFIPPDFPAERIDARGLISPVSGADGAAALARAGFDFLNLAANHILDAGTVGMFHAERSLAAAGLVTGGVGRTQREARAMKVIERGGVSFGFLSYCEDNNYTLSTVGPSCAYYTLETVLEDVRARRDEVDVLVVSIHGDIEFMETPSWPRFRNSRAIAEAGARIILGHHPHVPQGVEMHAGCLIAYSLGNFVFDAHSMEYMRENAPWTARSFLLLAEVDSHGVRSFERTPIVIGEPPLERPSVPDAAEREALMQRFGDLDRMLGDEDLGTAQLAREGEVVFHCAPAQRRGGRPRDRHRDALRAARLRRGEPRLHGRGGRDRARVSRGVREGRQHVQPPLLPFGASGVSAANGGNALKERLGRLGWKIAAIALGLAAAGAIAAATGASPPAFYRALVTGAFGSWGRVIATLAKTAPLLLAGLAVAVPLRAGLFNIGAEGQMYAGALAAVAAGLGFAVAPAWVVVPAAVVLGITAGGAYGALAGYLKARRGVHEVISTIMLNFVAWHFTAFLVAHGPLASATSVGRTATIPANARLPIVASSGAYELSASLVIALAAAAVAWWFVSRSVTGFRMRAAGGNPLAASRKGIDVAASQVWALAAGGAFAGLAGATEVAGVHYSLSAGFSPGYGFDGIAVALLAGASVVGLLPAALLFAALRAAGPMLQLDAGLSPQVIYCIEAVVIVAAAVPHAPALLARLRRRRAEERAWTS